MENLFGVLYICCVTAVKYKSQFGEIYRNSTIYSWNLRGSIFRCRFPVFPLFYSYCMTEGAEKFPVVQLRRGQLLRLRSVLSPRHPSPAAYTMALPAGCTPNRYRPASNSRKSSMGKRSAKCTIKKVRILFFGAIFE